MTTILSRSKELKHTFYNDLLVTIVSQSITNKSGQLNMIVLLVSYSQCCFGTIVIHNDILRSEKHDQHTTLELVLEARLVIRFTVYNFTHAYESSSKSHINNT